MCDFAYSLMVDRVEQQALALATVAGQNPEAVMDQARDRLDEWLDSPFGQVPVEDDRTRLFRVLGVA